MLNGLIYRGRFVYFSLNAFELHHFLPDPLLDGAICQLGLCERCLQAAEVRGHQIKGGAGASRHPLHSLQGASQRLHIKTSVRPGPATPASLSLSLSLLSFRLSHSPLPRGGGWRLGPSPLLMSLVRHTTMWSGGETQTFPVTNSIADEKKKPLYLSHGWCYDYQYGSYTILEYKSFSADRSFSVFVESEVAVVLFYFQYFEFICFIFLGFYLMLSVVSLLRIIYCFCRFVRGSTGA